jgi:cytochrome c oxidase subunit II
MSQPMPPSATDWWLLFTLFIYMGAAAAAIVIGAMVTFVIKHRARRERAESIPQPRPSGNRIREAVVLAAISIVILFTLTVASFRLTTSIQFPPPISESLVIDVTAFQWNFNYHYPNGATTLGDCYVPAGKPVIFNITSSDVMHNFGLPDFKLKIDAIPGRYNTLWATMPQLTGATSMNYTIRCYELCGTGHTYMVGNLTVMDPAAFNQWLNSQGPQMNMTGG